MPFGSEPRRSDRTLLRIICHQLQAKHISQSIFPRHQGIMNGHRGIYQTYIHFLRSLTLSRDSLNMTRFEFKTPFSSGTRRSENRPFPQQIQFRMIRPAIVFVFTFPNLHADGDSMETHSSWARSLDRTEIPSQLN